ncbi:hypothetical protein BDV12DRAFT_180560 [Aspergillus spectabilis]
MKLTRPLHGTARTANRPAPPLRGEVLGYKVWNRLMVQGQREPPLIVAGRTCGSTNMTNNQNPVICIFYAEQGCIFRYFTFNLIRII